MTTTLVDERSSILEKTEQELAALWHELDTVREELLAATAKWSAAQGVMVGQRLWGKLQMDDPGYLALRENVARLEIIYHRMLNQTIPNQSAMMNRLQQQALLEQRERWMQTHYASDSETLHKLNARLQTCSDWRIQQDLKQRVREIQTKLEYAWTQFYRERQAL